MKQRAPGSFVSYTWENLLLQIITTHEQSFGGGVVVSNGPGIPVVESKGIATLPLTLEETLPDYLYGPPDISRYP